MKGIDLIGSRFGSLVVIEKLPNRSTQRMWLCQCDCGNKCERSTNHLRNKGATDCGCIYRKKASERISERNYSHGGSNERLYCVWHNMHERCRNKKHSSYKDYGGRDISVCQEWTGRCGYQRFREWAIKSGYDPNAPHGECTLDRIDNDGDYSPENCRWVSMKVQSNNRRNSYLILDEGVFSLNDLEKRYGISKATLRYRYHKLGVKELKRITLPPRSKRELLSPEKFI